MHDRRKRLNPTEKDHGYDDKIPVSLLLDQSATTESEPAYFRCITFGKEVPLRSSAKKLYSSKESLRYQKHAAVSTKGGYVSSKEPSQPSSAQKSLAPSDIFHSCHQDEDSLLMSAAAADNKLDDGFERECLE